MEQQTLKSFIYEIQDIRLRACAKLLLTGWTDQEAFFVWPASVRHHHYYDGGLLAHTLEVVGIAVRLCDSHVIANKDVVIAACLFHDIGKIEEYGQVEGKWVRVGSKGSHIKLSADLFTEEALRFNVRENLIESVRHCIMSHHGRPEWGSEEEPLTVEAHIVHFADMLSAKFGKLK